MPSPYYLDPSGRRRRRPALSLLRRISSLLKEAPGIAWVKYSAQKGGHNNIEGNLPVGLRNQIAAFAARGGSQADRVADWRQYAYQLGISTQGRPGIAEDKRVINMGSRDRVGKGGDAPKGGKKRNLKAYNEDSNSEDSNNKPNNPGVVVLPFSKAPRRPDLPNFTM